MCLSGTAISPGYTAALVEEAGKPGLHAVRAGDTIDDWKVREIEPRYVVLARGDQAVRLDLAGSSADVPRAAAPPPAPPAGIRKGPVVHTRSLARGQRD
jgi:hypothetical protein